MDLSLLDADLREVIARNLPGYEIRAIAPVGEGIDNAAWEVNGELIIRLGKDSDLAARAESVLREAAVLAEVARISPLPVPEPVFVDAGAGVIAYPRLPGVPLNRLPSAPIETIAAALGGFIAAIHRAPPAVMETLVERDDYPPAAWLRDAERVFRTIADRLAPAQRAVVEDFLGIAPPPAPGMLVFCHNDLGSEHVLVDPSTGVVTGIIDWTDAAITDPARDLARLRRDLGADALAVVLAAYDRPLDIAERERIVFLARCALLEDIAYGLTGGDPIYADAGLARLDRVFG